MYCEICKSYGTHHPKCPEALPKKGIYACYECGEGIGDGEKYFEIGGNKYCEYCIQDMDSEEVLKLCGIEPLIADIEWNE